MDKRSVEILEGWTATSPFLDDACRASDANKNALGFVPRSVFDEFARHDQLLVLVERRQQTSVYLGHLMFQCRFPRASVIQMYVEPNSRRQGLAATLVSHLCKSLTNQGYTSIYARVAEDLSEANAFWNAQRFFVQRTEKGGATKGRYILVRCRELAAPQLFPTSGLDHQNPLGLTTSRLNGDLVYLIDLNVLYDLAPRRLRRTVVLALFQSERLGFCRLAVSTEFGEELRRTASTGRIDPMEAYISIFASFPFRNNDESAQLLENLANIVFPGKQLKPKDKSDLRHLATAIQHKLAGFITSDGPLLSVAPEIRKQYGVDVLSPDAFTLDTTAFGIPRAFEAPIDATLSFSNLQPAQENVAREFLRNLGLSATEITQGWLPSAAQSRVAVRTAVWDGPTMEGYLTCGVSVGTNALTLRAAVNEQSPRSHYTARLLLSNTIEQLAACGPRNLTLEVPEKQASLRDLAFELGFREEAKTRTLVKVLIGRVLTRATWNAVHAELYSKTSIKLPAQIPRYRGPDQQIELVSPDGNRRYVGLDQLETLVSPALLCLSGRPAVITPVQRKFSELLLRCNAQVQLLPQSSSAMYHERHYISGPQTLRQFERGTLMLFYESLKNGGRGELMAISRVRKAYIKQITDLSARDFDQSVLSPETVSIIGAAKAKTVTVFDNVFALPNPISLRRLQELGCGNPTDLITTHAIDDSQLQEILRDAFHG